MKKLLALVLAAFILLSMPVLRARAEEDGPTSPAAPAEPSGANETEEPGPASDPGLDQDPDDGEEPDPDEEPIDGPHDQPRRSKSLKSWEKDRKNISLTGKLREDILIIARSQLGYSADGTCYEQTSDGRKRYYTRYGDWYGSRFCDWCDAFVSFCVCYGGNESYPVESSCSRHMMKLKSAGYWREWNSYVPRKGDIVFFVFSSKNSMPTHVGLVEEIIPPKDGKPGKLITIEGNQRNPDGRTPCVRRMVRDVKNVVGYGTYEKGKIYPEACTVRSNGWTIIDEESRYFVERPTEEAMRFLGLINSRYYTYWFPEGSAEEAEPAKEAEPAEEPEPAKEAEPAEDGGADAEEDAFAEGPLKTQMSEEEGPISMLKLSRRDTGRMASGS